MKDVCSLIWFALTGLFRSRALLQAEILTLRHQLNVLRRKSPQRLTFTSIVLTTLSCSASGIFAIFCDLTLPTITRLAHTFQSTRTRRCREQYMPLVTFCPRHFLADSIICMYVFDFRQAQGVKSVKIDADNFRKSSRARVFVKKSVTYLKMS